MPGFPAHHQFLEFTQTHVHWVSDAIQPSHPLLPPSPPALTLSQHQGLFQWVSSMHQLAKLLSFSFNISPSKEHPGLMSFRMDWLDLLAIQGILKSLLQHHRSKASILQCSAFFISLFLSHFHTIVFLPVCSQCLCPVLYPVPLFPFSNLWHFNNFMLLSHCCILLLSQYTWPC